MKTSDTTVKTKTSVLGTLLTVAATTIATAIAMRNSDKIAPGFKSLAQHAADGTSVFPPPKGMNGKDRHPAPAA